MKNNCTNRFGRKEVASATALPRNDGHGESNDGYKLPARLVAQVAGCGEDLVNKVRQERRGWYGMGKSGTIMYVEGKLLEAIEGAVVEIGELLRSDGRWGD